MDTETLKNVFVSDEGTSSNRATEEEKILQNDCSTVVKVSVTYNCSWLNFQLLYILIKEARENYKNSLYTKSLTHICLGHFQGHDGENLFVGCWVAVAYDKAYYVGKVLSIDSEEEVHIDFLTKRKDGSYRWPRTKDTLSISRVYVFCSRPRVQKVGKDFVLHNVKSIEDQYESYKKRYMAVQ